MKYIVSFLSLFVLVSCQTTIAPGSHDDIQVNLFRGLQCPLQEETESAHWVRDDEALQRLFIGDHRYAIGERANLPQFDFRQRSLILVTMGQRPNAGYRLELLDEKPGRVGEDLVLRLRWKRPETGRLYAAVIMYPCLWLDMPKLSGGGIRILDEKGKQRFSLP